MISRTALWVVLGLVVACGEESEPEGVPDRGISRPAGGGVERVSAEELLALVRERNDPSAELSTEELAWLAEYDGVLERVMSNAPVTNFVADASKPHLTTRDYELWVLPAVNDVCFTVHDRQGKVLAERIDEVALSRDFSYLHNLLHPEYLQFYDVIDY